MRGLRDRFPAPVRQLVERLVHGLVDRLRVRLGLPQTELASESGFVDALLTFERKLTASQNRLLDTLFDERAQRSELETLDRLARDEERRMSDPTFTESLESRADVGVLRDRLELLSQKDSRKRRAAEALRREFAEHQIAFLSLTRAYDNLRERRALRPSDDLLMRKLAVHLHVLEREILEGAPHPEVIGRAQPPKSE